MKRSPIRDISPRSKRSRSAYAMSDHDMGRGISPDLYDRRDRRDMIMKKSYRDIDHEMDRPRAKYRDDRMLEDAYSPPPRTSETRQPEYRSLCISNISSKIPVPVLKETLYHEFKKYGEFNVNVTYSGDIRVAYINFRYPEDAREAKHVKAKLVLFDRPVRIEAVYQKKRSHSPINEFNLDRGGNDNYNSGYSGRGRGTFRGFPSTRRPSGRGYFQGPPRDMPPREQTEYRASGQYHPQKRNEKFPYHLDHIQPEDDEKATRTLFVGNLDYNISDDELKEVFGKYGTIEDIDIKRPQRGTGNAYAFIKYINLDCAHKAKVELSGQYIGRFQCKIGYGKVTATTCLWVGGLGTWITHETLEREFDRFGMINRIEWPRGKDYAYVLYDNLDAAQAACQEMRGAPLGGNDRRLRVDFADPNHIVSPERGENNGDRDGEQFFDHRRDGKESRSREDWHESDARNPDVERRHSESWDESRKRPVSPDDYVRRRKLSGSPDARFSKDPESRGRSRERKSAVYSQEKELGEIDSLDDLRNERKNSTENVDFGIDEVTNISDLAKCLPVAWNGAVILKNSAFPARMHVLSGNVTIVDTLMRDPSTTETPVLRVKQRLRLDQPKLEDVGRRVSSAGKGGHCILLAMTSTLQNYEDPAVQQRPLKNLVSYLRQKEAAGVISLPSYESKDKDDVGVLYAFPPCEFGYKYLTTKAPKLPKDPINDDYMVIVVVTGAG